VFVSAKGKLPHQSDVVVLDNQTNNLQLTLQDEPKTGLVEKTAVPTWLWIAGGTLVAGASVGAYFLLKPSNSRYEDVSQGSWGSLSL